MVCRWTIERLRLAIILAVLLLLADFHRGINFLWPLAPSPRYSGSSGASWNPDPADHAGICPVEDRTGPQNLSHCMPPELSSSRPVDGSCCTMSKSTCTIRRTTLPIPSPERISNTTATVKLSLLRENPTSCFMRRSVAIVRVRRWCTSPHTDWFSIKRQARRPAAEKWIFSSVSRAARR